MCVCVCVCVCVYECCLQILSKVRSSKYVFAKLPYRAVLESTAYRTHALLKVFSNLKLHILWQSNVIWYNSEIRGNGNSLILLHACPKLKYILINTIDYWQLLNDWVSFFVFLTFFVAKNFQLFSITIFWWLFQKMIDIFLSCHFFINT